MLNSIKNMAQWVWMAGYATTPDPFRFYPARHSAFWAPYFQWINRTLLNHQFKMPNTLLMCQPNAEFSKKTLANLEHPTMVVVNHINFADPQVVLEQAQIAKTPLWWMAGVEPFERMKGVQTFHLSNCGTFSLDRGVIDRNALLTAQRVLDEAQCPLVIFAEGEADYTQDVTSPYFEGAAGFALKTLKNPERDVRIIPVHLSYHFAEDTAKAFPLVWKAIVKLTERFDLPLPTEIKTSAETLKQMPSIHQNVLGGVVSFLKQSYGVEFLPSGSVELDVRSLLSAVFRRLCAEHDVSFDESVIDDYAGVMGLKNRLRSVIVRKSRVMKQKNYDRLMMRLESWEKEFAGKDSLGFVTQQALSKTEQSLLGWKNTDASMDKRLKTLRRHLKSMAPYVTMSEDANGEQHQQWQRQLLLCRELKLLKVLQRDLNTDWNTVEQIDEWRFKLTLLLDGKSVYVGPKHARMIVGAPQSLREKMTLEGDEDKLTPAVLTGWFRDWVTQLKPEVSI